MADCRYHYEGPYLVPDGHYRSQKYVQIRNPINDRWIKLDRETGRIVGEKKSSGPYKGVDIIVPKEDWQYWPV